MRELEIQVREIDRVGHDLAEYTIEATIVQAAGAQNQLAGNIQRIGAGDGCARLL